MSTFSKSTLIALSVICVVFASGAMQDNQDDETENHQLTVRINNLEKRVEQLELILFSTGRLSVLEAERRLAEAESTLKNSELLLTKGFVTEFQLQRAQFDVQEAVQQLKLAKTENRQQELTSNLEFIQLERNLKDLTAQLEYKKKLLDRGFSTVSEVERLQRGVDQLKRAVDNAKLKADAAKNLETLRPKSAKKENDDK